MKRKQPKRLGVGGNDDGPPPERDPVIEARVERAVAPYKALLSADDLEFMKDNLRLYLGSHPDVAPLVDRLRPRAEAGSGDRPRAGLEDGQEEPTTHQKVKPGS